MRVSSFRNAGMGIPQDNMFRSKRAGIQLYTDTLKFHSNRTGFKEEG